MFISAYLSFVVHVCLFGHIPITGANPVSVAKMCRDEFYSGVEMSVSGVEKNSSGVVTICKPGL